MKMQIYLNTICLTAVLAATGHPVFAARANVELEANRILWEMSEYLMTASEMSFEAQITYDAEMTEGQIVQYGAAASIAMRRPGELRVRYDGDERKSQAFFNGKTFTAFDAVRKLYAVMETPGKLDDAQDFIGENYGFSVPIADFLYTDPYEVLIEFVESGFLVGRHAIDGMLCNHLAFSQEEIDWQIWIEDGPRPLPRKMLITYKNLPGSPQYTAAMSDWDFSPHLSEHAFEFHPSAEASQIEFLELTTEEEQP